MIPAAPFTLPAAGFVHVMAHARMTSTDEWGGYGTCDGSPGNGPALAAVIDGTLYSSLSGALNPGLGTSGRASQDSFWLGAGTHEIAFELTPNACAATADGTTHVDQLAASVVAYQ